MAVGRNRVIGASPKIFRYYLPKIFPYKDKNESMTSHIRNPKDFWTGVLYAVIGLAAVLIGGNYAMGTATKMGPAYFPTVLGALLALIGLIAIMRSFLRAGAPIEGIAYRAVMLILASTILFGLLLRGAGVVIALIVLVMLSSYASIKFRWGPALALAVGLAVFSVLVFVKGLGVPLSILGSWFGG